MDNIAHTLAGLALAETGLKRRTALGTATLAIAANLPDIDAITYVMDVGLDPLVVRRGWTHGPIAMVALPLLLTAIMVGWDRAFGDKPGRRHTPVNVGWVFALALIGVLSHPLLDLMNTYGVRLMMPFSGRWFYGDGLFIVDPWLWVTLAVGVLLSRRRARRTRDASAGITHPRRRSSREVPTSASWVTRPARVAVGAVVVYAGAMVISGAIGRHALAQPPGGARAERVMVGPVVVNPLRRDVVRDLGDRYEVGTLRFTPGILYEPRGFIDAGRALPGVAAASATEAGAGFLSWARFPYFQTQSVGDSISVRISDARYADERGRGWATVVVTVPRDEGR